MSAGSLLLAADLLERRTTRLESGHISDDGRFVRVQELQARHFRELRTIIAKSEPVERVVLTVQQLIPLDG
jgi:hypothetical protein